MPKRGRPSSRSATRQSRVAERASKASSRRRRPAKGRETSRGADRRLLLSAAGGRLQPERSPRGRIQGGGELRTAYPSAAPNSMPAVWRRGPRLLNVASGLAHRSAQHLTPLRGRPLPKGRGDGEGRSQGPCTGTDALGEGQFPRARGPCAAGPSPEGPAANNHVAVDI